MDFFNPSTAATLQYISFPLEVIGLTLALIEVRFPTTAARMTRTVERLAQPVDELRHGRPTGAGEMEIERALGTLLQRVLTVGFVVLFGYFAIRTLVDAMTGALAADWLVGTFITLIVTSIITAVGLTLFSVIVYFTVIGGSDFARRFVAGRAIGTLGILIAGCGVLLEGYQFLQQIVDA